MSPVIPNKLSVSSEALNSESSPTVSALLPLLLLLLLLLPVLLLLLP